MNFRSTVKASRTLETFAGNSREIRAERAKHDCCCNRPKRLRKGALTAPGKDETSLALQQSCRQRQDQPTMLTVCVPASPANTKRMRWL
jgi:hypothetical protein